MPSLFSCKGSACWVEKRLEVKGLTHLQTLAVVTDAVFKLCLGLQAVLRASSRA